MSKLETSQARHAAKRAFEEVIELPCDARSAYLDQHYGDDPGLVREVRSLLRFHSLDEDPLEGGCHVGSTILQDALSSQIAMGLPSVVGYDDFAKIAEGGQSVVYRARQVSTGQSVAVKFLSSRTLLYDSVHRLQQETKVLAELQHPNIVTVIDQPQAGPGMSCLVTRFIRGLPLDEFARRLSANKWQMLLTTCERITNAMDAAHRSGVVHRDLKPSNILVDENNEPFVLDFGLAKDIKTENRAQPPARTQDGQFLGTVAWASPEQIDGSLGKVGPQTDIYQLGVVFYALFSEGRFPYSTEGGHLQVFQRILHDEPAELLNPSFSQPQLAQINRVLKRALEKSPLDRFATTAEFGEALAAVNLERPVPSIRVPSGKNKTLFWLTGALALAVATAALWQSFSLARPRNGHADDRRTKDTLAANSGSSLLQGNHQTESLIQIDFADLRAPHLPPGWRGDDVVFVDHGQMTVPKGTRAVAMVRSSSVDVDGDWVLIVDHQIAGNGLLQFIMCDDMNAKISVSIHRGRIEHQEDRSEKTTTVGQRTLTVRREQDRLVATLQGARPLHLDASMFGSLAELQFGMCNAGSGGGEVGVHRVQLERLRTTNGE